MNGHERIYRALLRAYPRRHRDDYGEPMVQLMRDRLRDDGGGVHSLLVWCGLLTDLVVTAVRERMEAAMHSLRHGWWRFAAVVVAGVLGSAGLHTLFEPATGPWYRYVLGPAALLASPVVVVAGLVLRSHHPRNGSIVVAVGVLPGVAALVLFWWPPFLLFGLLSLSVVCFAVDDADRHHRATVR